MRVRAIADESADDRSEEVAVGRETCGLLGRKQVRAELTSHALMHNASVHSRVLEDEWPRHLLIDVGRVRVLVHPEAQVMHLQQGYLRAESRMWRCQVIAAAPSLMVNLKVQVRHRAVRSARGSHHRDQRLVTSQVTDHMLLILRKVEITASDDVKVGTSVELPPDSNEGGPSGPTADLDNVDPGRERVKRGLKLVDVENASGGRLKWELRWRAGTKEPGQWDGQVLVTTRVIGPSTEDFVLRAFEEFGAEARQVIATIVEVLFDVFL